MRHQAGRPAILMINTGKEADATGALVVHIINKDRQKIKGGRRREVNRL